MDDTAKGCVFCDIAARTAPAHPIFEDNLSYAILDINPFTQATAWCCLNGMSPGGTN